MTEVEIKLKIEDPEQASRLLREHGYAVRTPRTFESNTLYDTQDLALRAQRRILRIRLAGGRTLVTFKGAPGEGPHKIREEVEFCVDSEPQAALLFDRLGYRAVFRYEKYRTEFERPGEPGHITLDETPIGVYFELEGDPAWIDRTAAELGFAPGDYITDSYGRLYFRHCETQGIVPSHMVFTQG